ncbi:MAG TPA: sugar phosphate isomerase/epimerase [Gaiellaceae bacterium]|nr:sugar phosphate isomerase/epimerase [Gaiellaceae bacterium]
MPNAISFMTANFVARETGYAMRDWGHGHHATSDAFAPLATFAERFDGLLGEIRELGFDAIDLWSAHLAPEWATDAHVEAARAALDRHGLSVASYATSVSPGDVDRVCELASAVGVDLLTGGFSSDVERLAPALERHGVRLGFENHPERTPAEVLATIDRGGPMLGATVDTGWWGTQGYDPVRAIEELDGRILHVHLKDVLARGAHDTCRWGLGVVPIEDCVRALGRIGYEGPLSVEHEPPDVDPSDDARAMRAELAGWLA